MPQAIALVTGATGNAGLALCRRLLQEGWGVVALVREGRTAAFLGQVAREDAIFVGAARLEVVEGDITWPQCGLGLNALPQVTHIIHCAANVSWGAPAHKLWETNVAGTRNVLALARALHGRSPLASVLILSSAYVCGQRRGEGIGAEMRPTGFNNAYEATKHLAERLALDAADLPVSIVRPLGVETRPSCMDLVGGRVQKVSGEDMAFAAATAALDDAGIQPADVDVIISCSSFFDFMGPSVSSRLLKRMGMDHAQTYDLMGGCAEFLHGLHLARLLIAAGEADTVLVTASEVITAWWAQVRHPLEYYIFGDTGGAFLLSNRPGLFEISRSFVQTDANVNGQAAELICVPILGGKAPAPLFYEMSSISAVCAAQSDIPAEYRIVHNAHQVGLAAPMAMTRAVTQILEEAQVNPGEVYLVPHQASRNVMSLLSNTGIPQSQIGISLPYRGNMSTASIPVTLSDHRDEAFSVGSVVLTSVGVGMSYGAMLLEPVAAAPSAIAKQPHAVAAP